MKEVGGSLNIEPFFWLGASAEEADPALVASDQVALAIKADCIRCFMDDGGKMRVRMFLCPACGNKRCPKATDHRFDCTGSNEPGQAGSAYA